MYNNLVLYGQELSNRKAPEMDTEAGSLRLDVSLPRPACSGGQLDWVGTRRLLRISLSVTISASPPGAYLSCGLRDCVPNAGQRQLTGVFIGT